MSINRRQPLLYFLLLWLQLQRSAHAPAVWTPLYYDERDYMDVGDGDLSYYDAAAVEDVAPDSVHARMRFAQPMGDSGTADAGVGGKADWEEPTIDNQLMDSANFIAHALLAGSGEEAGVLGQGEQYALMTNAVTNAVADANAAAAAGWRRDSSEALRRDEVALRCKPNSPEEQARLDAAVKNTQDTIEHVTTLIRAMREHAVAIIKDISELEADFLGSCSDGGNGNNDKNDNSTNKSASNNSNGSSSNSSKTNSTNNNISDTANCMPTANAFNNNGNNMTQPNDRANSYSNNNRNGNCNPSDANNNNGICADYFANYQLNNVDDAGRLNNNNNLNRNGNDDSDNNNKKYILKNSVLSENLNSDEAESESGSPNGFIGDLNNNNNNNVNTEGRRPQWSANFNTNNNNNINKNNKNMNNNNNNIMNSKNNAGTLPRIVVSEFAVPIKTDLVGMPNQFMEQAQYAVRSWKNQIEDCKRLLDAAVQQSAQYERDNAESDGDGMRQHIKLIHSAQGCGLNGPEIVPSAAASLTLNNRHDHHKMSHNNNHNAKNINKGKGKKKKKKAKLSEGARGDSAKSSSNASDKETNNKGDKSSVQGGDEAGNKQSKEKRTNFGFFDELRGVGL